MARKKKAKPLPEPPKFGNIFKKHPDGSTTIESVPCDSEGFPLDLSSEESNDEGTKVYYSDDSYSFPPLPVSKRKRTRKKRKAGTTSGQVPPMAKQQSSQPDRKMAATPKATAPHNMPGKMSDQVQRTAMQSTSRPETKMAPTTNASAKKDTRKWSRERDSVPRIGMRNSGPREIKVGASIETAVVVAVATSKTTPNEQEFRGGTWIGRDS